MNNNISSGPPPAPLPQSPATEASRGQLSAFTQTSSAVWITVSDAVPIPSQLRATANQSLETLLASLSVKIQNPLNAFEQATSPAHKPTAGNQNNNLNLTPPTLSALLSPPPLAELTFNQSQLTRLIQASQLFLVRALVGKQALSFISDQTLNAGAQLQVKASAAGFTVIVPSTAPATLPQKSTGTLSPQSPQTLNVINETLRKALPQQQSSAAAVKNLMAAHHKLLSLPNDNAALKTSKPLIDAIQKLLQANALSTLTNAGALRSAINNSGLFAEAKLIKALGTSPTTGLTNNKASEGISAPPQQLSQDTKIQLWQLLAQVTPHLTASTGQAGTANSAKPTTPSPLAMQLLNLLGLKMSIPTMDMPNKTAIKQVLSEAGKQWLAKITAQQLAAISDDPDQQNIKSFSVELPARIEQQVTPIQLHFTKYWHSELDDESTQSDREKTTAKEAVWQVTLSINIEKLGAIDARIRFIQQRLQCSLWAEQPATLALVQQEAIALAQAIQQKGLAVEPIRCHSGRIPSPKNNLSQTLLDTHA